MKRKYEKVIEMLKKENENSLKNLLEEGLLRKLIIINFLLILFILFILLFFAKRK